MYTSFKAKVLHELLKAKVSLDPLVHCPDELFEDYDDWVAVKVEGTFYLINIWSNGDDFSFTAYEEIEYDCNKYRVDYSNFTTILKLPVHHYKQEKLTRYSYGEGINYPQRQHL